MFCSLGSSFLKLDIPWRYSKTWIVKPNQSTCVINNINHIRLIIDKWDWFTFNDHALSHSCHYNILIHFHQQPFFFLNTHCQEFIDYFRPCMSMSGQQIHECMISNISVFLLALFLCVLVCFPWMQFTQVSKISEI
jgi:hypothetical protein